MFKFLLICAMAALAAAKPSVYPVAYSAYSSPVAAAYSAPYAYSAYSAPVAYSAYSAYSAPVAYADPYSAYYLGK